MSDARTHLAWEIAAARWSPEYEPADSDYAIADRIIASRNLAVLTLEEHASLCGRIEELEACIFEAAMTTPINSRFEGGAK